MVRKEEINAETYMKTRSGRVLVTVWFTHSPSIRIERPAFAFDTSFIFLELFRKLGGQSFHIRRQLSLVGHFATCMDQNNEYFTVAKNY